MRASVRSESVIPVVLAHGALGPFDELLFIVVGVVFVGLMVTAWIRSRNSPLDDEPDAADPAPPGAADPTPDARPDHYPLS
jgi:hypothetical protein